MDKRTRTPGAGLKERYDDLQHRFNYHKPPEGSTVGMAHEKMRGMCHVAAVEIVNNTPECREQSLALTKLEEAMFWANAAVARHHEHYAEGQR